MAWTTPKTDWATGELVSASDLNAVNENLAALKNPATVVYTSTEDIAVPNHSTFTDIDSNKFNLTITTTGGDVLVNFDGAATTHDFRIDVEVDGTRQGDVEYGLRRGGSYAHNEFVSFTRLVQNLSAGSHTFKLQGKFNTTLRAGAQFWVREVS